MIPNKVVIFDGDCAFCNRSVLFILKKSKKQDVFVCASQSNAGKKLIKDLRINADPKQTLIYLENKRVYIRSNAVLQLSNSLKGGYFLLNVFRVFPRSWRDGVYNFIAKRRKKLIKNDRCSFELASTYKDKVIA